jgi:hypothetical protein
MAVGECVPASKRADWPTRQRTLFSSCLASVVGEGAGRLSMCGKKRETPGLTSKKARTGRCSAAGDEPAPLAIATTHRRPRASERIECGRWPPSPTDGCGIRCRVQPRLDALHRVPNEVRRLACKKRTRSRPRSVRPPTRTQQLTWRATNRVANPGRARRGRAVRDCCVAAVSPSMQATGTAPPRRRIVVVTGFRR